MNVLKKSLQELILFVPNFEIMLGSLEIFYLKCHKLLLKGRAVTFAWKNGLIICTLEGDKDQNLIKIQSDITLLYAVYKLASVIAAQLKLLLP